MRALLPPSLAPAVTAPSGTTSYAHDALGRVTSITDPAGGVTTFTYDAAGHPASRTQPNGVTTTYTRDLRDRLTTIESRTATNALLARYAYTLDLAGNRTEVLEHTGRRVSWQYDALSRLTSETIEDPGEPPVTEGFGYDAVGNRVLHATPAGVFTPSYDANDRLLSDGTATYAWDANGNLASRTDASGTTSFAFDARDRLVEVDGPASGLVEHVYDHAGDRVETRVNGATTRYLVDANRGLSQVIEDRDGLGGLVAAFVHSDAGEPLARMPGAGPDPAYFLHDGQGSVRQIADPLAAITDAYDYSAFGETLAASGATPNPYRYGGQWEEASSGLYHLRARWMDPRVGRFLSTDPFAGFDNDPITTHPTLYARQNPVLYRDPTGRTSIAELATTIAVRASLAAISFQLRFGFLAETVVVATGFGVLESAHTLSTADPSTPEGQIAIAFAVVDFLPEGKWITRPLRGAAAGAWRHAARQTWDALSKVPRGLDQVHHLIPLEWSHVFPRLNPNRLDNLALVPERIHNGPGGVSAMWTEFRNFVGDRTPTPQEVLAKAAEVQAKFGANFTRLEP